MKTEIARELYAYWNELRGRRPAPDRNSVDPSDIRRLLGDTFILEPVDRRTYRFRLAGTRLCAAYCRELKGVNFLDLWGADDREALGTLLAAITDDAAAAVLGVNGQASGARNVAFEMLLLPLAHDGPGFNRVLGGMTAMDRPFWLGMDPIHRQVATSMRLIWPDARPHFLQRRSAAATVPTPLPRPPVTGAEAAKAARRRFTVLDGGRR